MELHSGEPIGNCVARMGLDAEVSCKEMTRVGIEQKGAVSWWICDAEQRLEGELSSGALKRNCDAKYGIVCEGTALRGEDQELRCEVQQCHETHWSSKVGRGFGRAQKTPTRADGAMKRYAA